MCSVLAWGSSPAHAQSTAEVEAHEPPPASAEPSEPPASVETPPAQSKASESQATRAAHELTLRAQERFDAGDYAAALAEFTRAYEVLADDRRRALLLNNMAVCQERLFRYDLALQYYQRYLREADSDPEDRVEVEAVIRGLRDLLGKLHITSNVRAEVWIDDRSLGFAPGDLEVPAGTRVLKLQAPGRQTMQRELLVVARATQTIHLELAPLPEYHGIDRHYFWSAIGLTSVALVVGTGLGASALAKYNDAKDLNQNHLLTSEAQQPMLNQALAADVAFGVAALLAASSAVLFFVTDFRAPEQRQDVRAQARTTRVALRPSVSTRSLTLSVRGAWR